MATLRKRGIFYHVRWLDADGVSHEKSVGRDKRVAEQAKARIEGEVDRRRAGLLNSQDLKIRYHEARPLGDHLDDWRRDIIARGKTARHADQYFERAGKLVALIRGESLADLEPGRKPKALEEAASVLKSVLKSARLSDLASERIQSVLASLLEAGKSHQTANHYRAAIRAFVRWAAEKGRLRENPMRGVDGYNAEEDLRHVRRGLTDDELVRLIRAAHDGPELFGMPGGLRAMAYRVAASTGFRADEMRGLSPESFRLDGSAPSIYLKASGTKNRKPANQPISTALADDLRRWLREQPPGEPPFPLHHETAKAIRIDLEAAGIPYETDEGVADFHSLRSYYVSALIRSGASVSVVRALARHAESETTLKHYAKANPVELRGAVEGMPTATAPRGSRTDSSDQHIGELSAQNLPKSGDWMGRPESDLHGSPDFGRPLSGAAGSTQTQDSDAVRRVLSDPDGNRAERGGFEPPRPLSEPNGLANRRRGSASGFTSSISDSTPGAAVAPRVALGGSVPVAASASGPRGAACGSGSASTAPRRSRSSTFA
jgi:site-specific recombinase XerD